MILAFGGSILPFFHPGSATPESPPQAFFQGAHVQAKCVYDEVPMFLKKAKLTAASLQAHLTVTVHMLTESFRNLGGSRKIGRWASHLKVEGP